MDIASALKIEAETPFMVIDEDQTRKNISRIEKLASSSGKNLRPHSKTHKIPEIARWQIEAGAIGVCVQKVSEAEVMFNGGVQNILISNEIVDRRKTDRIAKLAAAGCRITVAIDSLYGARNLSESAKYNNLEIPVLLDLDLGMHRCGIDPQMFDHFLESVKNIGSLTIDGIMAYDGNVHGNTLVERTKSVTEESRVLEPIVSSFVKKKLGRNIISVAGTPSAEAWSKIGYVNELQPGTYIFYDLHCREMNLCSTSEISSGVVAQVMSKGESGHGRIVLDAGYKSISIDQGVVPEVMNENGIIGKVIAMSEEHTVVEPTNNSLEIGEKVVMLTYHACTTTDYWDRAWMFSKSHMPLTISIEGRGKRE